MVSARLLEEAADMVTEQSAEHAQACRRASEQLWRVREALHQIAKGEGAFSRDPLEHAGNCIDSMKSIARTALEQFDD